MVLSICGSAISVVILAGFQTPRVAGSRPADVKLRPFPSVLSPSLPYDVDEAKINRLMGLVHPENGGEYSPEDTGRVIVAEREFDILSWQAFLALNWPQKAYGLPGPTLDDPNGKPLWSFWVPMEKIFLPNGARPEFPWNPAKEGQEVADSENGQFGRWAHANYSWMLQIETSKQNVGTAAGTQ